MEIKIGISNFGREVAVETESTGDDIEQALRTALATEGGVLTIVGDKGRRILIPASQVGYLDLGQDRPRAVGFGAFDA